LGEVYVLVSVIVRVILHCQSCADIRCKSFRALWLRSNISHGSRYFILHP